VQRKINRARAQKDMEEKAVMAKELLCCVMLVIIPCYFTARFR
jgi:hypothetical protein